MLNSTTFQYALKRRYPQTEIENEVLKDNPALAIVPKDTESIAGDAMALALTYGDNQGRSHVFATAQANLDNNKGVQFLLQTIDDFAVARIKDKVIKQSKGNPGAFLRAAEKEIDSTLNALKRNMGVEFFRSGTGSRGQRSGALSGNILTLTQIQDVTNFEVGMKIKASAADGGALRAGTAATIDSIDEDLGTLTSTTWGNITAFAASDFLYVEGDAANGGANVGLSGLAAWIPSTAPGSTAFFGVDRTPNVTRLAGIRMDLSSRPLLEGGVQLANRIARSRGSPDYWVMNFEQFGNVLHELGSRVVYVDIVGSNGRVGFTGCMITAGKQKLVILPDQNCPHNLSYQLQLDSWKLYSMGPAPDFLDEDGLKMSRLSDDTAYETRIGVYYQLGCTAPGYNGVGTMPT
jgi:hypothetical protein